MPGEELKYKMHAYEVKPPVAVWDAIAEELEEHPVQKPLVEKMRSYEVAPPASAWRTIVAALKAEAPAKIISLQQTYRWAAAAAVILLLTAAAYYFFDHSATDRTIVHAQGASNPSNVNEQMLADNRDEDADSRKPISHARLASASGYDREKLYNDNNILPLSYVEDADPFPGNEQSISVTPRPILAANGELIQDKSVINPHNEKYISITAPNGQQTKISSRLINAMHYLTASGPEQGTDDMMDTENTWQERIHQWRAKLLQSAFVPSSGNFLDILEMTELVDEEKKEEQ